jgi:chromosomal replication initiation ATPase DnaA
MSLPKIGQASFGGNHSRDHTTRHARRKKIRQLMAERS